MAIARHEPCPHGKEKSRCASCKDAARIDYLEDRIKDLEAAVFGEQPEPEKEKDSE
jgi:hypothetical protein